MLAGLIDKTAPAIVMISSTELRRDDRSNSQTELRELCSDER
jgi:hypothetical protein